jgi:YbbR domain-containing protein
MRTLFTENFWLKVSAVLLAGCLWLYVTSRGQLDISFEVPLEFKDVPAGLGIAGNTAKTVTVTVRGQERLMKNLKPSDIRVRVDLAKAKKGENTIAINKDDIQLPYAMTVTGISPPANRVRLEEIVSKNVPVRAYLTGEPERGFYVKAVEVRPRTVTVQGLRSEVRKVGDVIKTEPMDITGLTETTTQELNIDTSMANVKARTESVKVTVVIAGRKR